MGGATLRERRGAAEDGPPPTEVDLGQGPRCTLFLLICDCSAVMSQDYARDDVFGALEGQRMLLEAIWKGWRHTLRFPFLTYGWHDSCLRPMCAQRRGALPPLLEPEVPQQSTAWTPGKEPLVPVRPWEERYRTVTLHGDCPVYTS